MKFRILTQAIEALNCPSITIDWRYNSVIFSGAHDGYKIALGAIVQEHQLMTESTQNFNIEVLTEDLVETLEKLNPSSDPHLELLFQVITDRVETGRLDGHLEAQQILQISTYVDEDEDYAPDFYEVRAIVNHVEALKTFYLDEMALRKLAGKGTVEFRQFKIKATKKAAEVTTKVTKKDGIVKTINVPQRDIALAVEKDWTISVCLLEGDKLKIVHINGTVITLEKTVHTSVPTIATIHFSPQEWVKMEVAARLTTQLQVRSPEDENLQGIEVHTGRYPRIKGFSGISVYSTEIGRSDNSGRFLIPIKAIYEFARISQEISESSLTQSGERVITVFFQENNQFLMTSEIVALRGELMDINLYPSNWHELPVSKEVPAEFSRDEFLQALSGVTRWLNWRNPTDNYCRIWWEDDSTLTFQGVDGLVTLTPKNKGYDTTPYKCYVSAVALADIIETVDSRIRIALPTTDTEMCRISDDKTEAALCVLHEPHFISFRKEQQALPDKLVQEVLDSNDSFVCRAIEINPIAQAESTPEPGEVDEEIDIISEVSSFARTYQSYKVFSEDECPVADTIRDIYRLATPDGFAKAKSEITKSRVDFNEYILVLADLADDLSTASETIVEILGQDTLSQEIPRLRILWQASLNKEYYRGYKTALIDVKREAELRGIEGVAEICENLRSKLPDDLAKIAERLRIWVGRMLIEEEKLAPIAQIEFRPQ